MANYPTSLANFFTYQDQPGDANSIIQAPNPNPPPATVSVNLTYDHAYITNQLNSEIVAIESTIAARPFTVPKTVTVGASVVWLYKNKAGINHTHIHATLADLKADAHPQYMTDTGEVGRPQGFTHPITSPPAVHANQLANLAQVQSLGVTVSTATTIIENAFPPNTVRSFYGNEVKIMGGMAKGYTDSSGNLWVPFDPPFASLVTFVYNKMPFPGESMLGWYAYQYMEDQLILLSLTNSGALIQFIEDIAVDRQALVCMSWMAIGV